MIDSIYDDSKLALFEARRVDQSKRYSGLKVVEEIYHEGSNTTTARTIFRGGKAETEERLRKAEARKRLSRPMSRGGGQNPIYKGRTKPKPKTSSFLIPILILGFLVIAALGALFGVKLVSELR